MRWLFRALKPLQRFLARRGIVIYRQFGTGVMSKKELESDRARYKALNKDTRFAMDSRFDYICRCDKYAPNAVVDNGYFVQDIWGAQKVLEKRPKIHYDVGSSVAGFVAHLAAQRQKVEIIDIRAMKNDFNTAFFGASRAESSASFAANSTGGGGD